MLVLKMLFVWIQVCFSVLSRSRKSELAEGLRPAGCGREAQPWSEVRGRPGDVVFGSGCGAVRV